MTHGEFLDKLEEIIQEDALAYSADDPITSGDKVWVVVEKLLQEAEQGD